MKIKVSHNRNTYYKNMFNLIYVHPLSVKHLLVHPLTSQNSGAQASEQYMNCCRQHSFLQSIFGKKLLHEILLLGSTEYPDKGHLQVVEEEAPIVEE